MATIDDVLERLVTDGDFRVHLARDPAAALGEYDLTEDELRLLASRLDTGDVGERTVEQRTSKSAMLSFLSALGGGGGGGGGTASSDSFFDIDLGTDASAAGGEKGGTADLNIGIGEQRAASYDAEGNLASQVDPAGHREHEGEIDLHSTDWGVSQGPEAADGGGEVAFGDGVRGARPPAEASKGGNAETTWKVEEGEAAAGGDPDDFMDDHPPSGAAGGKAETTWKVEEGEKAAGRPEKIIMPPVEPAAAPGTELDDIGAPTHEQEAGFVKLGDIKGEATDEEAATAGGYLKVGDIKGESGTGAAHGGTGAGSGKVSMAPEAEAKGAVFPKIDIEAAADPAGGEVPTEEVSLNFTKIQVDVGEAGRDAGLSPPVSAEEDFLEIDDA